jgi:hypothetical protein
MKMMEMVIIYGILVFSIMIIHEKILNPKKNVLMQEIVFNRVYIKVIYISNG